MRRDDDRIGRQLAVIRRRSAMTQVELSATAGVPRRDVQLVEGGHAGAVKLERIERLFEAVGGRARLATWWNGAAADRLLDEEHASLVERAVDLFRRRNWSTNVEVSFSEFGERGSLDILAARRSASAVAVVEVKSELGSIEETNRRLDVKARLGPKIARERFGWEPQVVGRVLVVPERDSIRRLVAQHSRTMAAAYPARSREVRAWLRHPDAPIRGLWFISIARQPSSVPARRPAIAAPASDRSR